MCVCVCVCVCAKGERGYSLIASIAEFHTALLLLSPSATLSVVVVVSLALSREELRGLELLWNGEDEGVG